MIFQKKQHNIIQTTNTKLDKLREKPLKTLDEQKEFINLKYPKKGKFKFKWAMVPKFLLNIAFFGGFIFLYRFILNYFEIKIPVWVAIIFIILFPLVVNLILERFRVQKSDIRNFF